MASGEKITLDSPALFTLKSGNRSVVKHGKFDCVKRFAGQHTATFRTELFPISALRAIVK
jgi:hypothetical protein